MAELATQGWTVLARNWRGGGGELDAVVRRSGEIRFVEVKLRDLEDPLSDEAVTPSKRSKLRGAARAWLLAQGALPGAPNDGEPEREVCFLVAMVDPGGRIDWVDDAFDG